MPFRFLHDLSWKRFQLKSYALVQSPFREVLLLDADCYPARNPSSLFDGPEYRKRGAMFWPEPALCPGYIPEAIAEVFGTEVRGPALDSGLMLIDKETCWAPLQLTLWYNARADLVYNLVRREKDTFAIAWSRLGREFALPSKPAVRDLHTVLQHGPGHEEVLFQHRCADKFRLVSEHFSTTPQQFEANHYYPALAHEDKCFEFLDELKSLLAQT
jgi:hypothetical protein